MGDRNSENVYDSLLLELKKKNINLTIKLIANRSPNASQGKERVRLVPMSIDKGIVNTSKYHK